MKSAISRIGGVFVSRSFLFITGAFLLFALIGVTTVYADDGNRDIRCGIMQAFGDMPIPRRDECPPPAPTATSTPPASPDRSLEQMVETIINDTVASTTINHTSGSTTVTGTVNPLTGLDIQVNTPFGGIHLFDPVCKLIIRKIVVGGTASSSDFMINVMLNGMHIGGSPKAGSSSGTIYSNLVPGTYTVSEPTVAGYTATFSGDCDATGTVVLPPNGTATCVVTNTFATSTNPGGGTGTTTPGCTVNCGGTSTTTPGGGGGCVTNCGSGSSGGGGTTGGGGNGPIQTGGGTTAPGIVAGTSTSAVPVSTQLPLIPNTGFGDAFITQMMLLMSGTVAIAGSLLLLTGRRTSLL